MTRCRIATLGLTVSVLAALAMACAGPEPVPENEEPELPRVFVEVSAERGIDFVHRSGASGDYYYPESMGSGVGLCDLDGDGDLDAYLVQSGGFDAAGHEASGNRLYWNLGKNGFRPAGPESGAESEGYGMGVACGDFDGDLDVDLYVTNVGPNTLLKNLGDGTFRDVTERAGVGDDGWGTGAVFFDADGDRDLDLFVTNYLHWAPSTEQVCRTNDLEREYCGPNHYLSPARYVLFFNSGDGTFEEVTEEMHLHQAFGNGLGATAADFDLDGRPDLYVANDQMPNQLWRSRVPEPYENEATLSGTAVNASGTAEAGMGVQAFDIENDGDLDLFLSHLAGETNTLYENVDPSAGFFRDATVFSGLGPESVPRTGFGLGFADFDQDGAADLYVTCGRVIRGRPVYDPDDAYAEPDLLFLGRGGGKFEPRPIPDLPVATGRGLAQGDVDGDLDLDLLINHRDAAPSLLQNEASSGYSILVEVRERDGSLALGASIEMKTAEGTQWRTVQTGYGYLSSQSPRVHFGLGPSDQIESLTVHWTDGAVTRYRQLGGDQILRIRRGAG